MSSSPLFRLAFLLSLLLLLLLNLPLFTEAACPLKCPQCIQPTSPPSSSSSSTRAPRSGSQPPQTVTPDWIRHGVATFNGGFDLPPILHKSKITYKGIGVFVFRLDNPLKHFSVVPPANNQCPGFFKTTETAMSAHCKLAVNAGFFDIHTGDCIGNIYSNGTLVQLSGLGNINFGITKGGEYIIGYLSQEEVQANSLQFAELVSGVLWLVRERQPYYCQSYNIEQPWAYFVDQAYPRTVVGHDEAGRLYILVVEANAITSRGLSIPDATDLALKYNLVNAVNLDGGGSTTVAFDGILQNHVTDTCKENVAMKCERKVNSILCIK